MSKIIYLIIFSFVTISFAYYGLLVWGQTTADDKISSEYALLISFYPLVICIFHSCLRLYLLPAVAFDAWSGIAPSDSDTFKKYNTWVSIISTFLGLFILMYPLFLQIIFVTVHGF
ncbi:MAG: hypothetical protein LBH59_06565 [Planctomycetaceae bacterium]|jgi:hypothetical protein|nr:hypothetical protein [Planctomycetaceae bacterium]